MSAPTYTREEDETLVDNYLELERKGLYFNMDFWCKLTDRQRADGFRDKTWTQNRDRIDDLVYKEDQDERYFEVFGEHYEDYEIPAQEDEENDDSGSESGSDTDYYYD